MRHQVSASCGGLNQQVGVLIEYGQAESRGAGLTCPQYFPWPPQLKILFCQVEAVLTISHHAQALSRTGTEVP